MCPWLWCAWPPHPLRETSTSNPPRPHHSLSCCRTRLATDPQGLAATFQHPHASPAGVARGTKRSGSGSRSGRMPGSWARSPVWGRGSMTRQKTPHQNHPRDSANTNARTQQKKASARLAKSHRLLHRPAICGQRFNELSPIASQARTPPPLRDTATPGTQAKTRPRAEPPQLTSLCCSRTVVSGEPDRFWASVGGGTTSREMR